MTRERSNTLWLAATALAALFMCWLFSEEARDAKTNEKKAREEIVELRTRFSKKSLKSIRAMNEALRELKVCAADEYALGLMKELADCKRNAWQLLDACEPRKRMRSRKP